MQLRILTLVALFSSWNTTQIIAGEKRNGGDLVLGYFIEGIDLAINYLDHIDANEIKIPNNVPPELVAKGFDKDKILNWFQENKEALQNEIKNMSFETGKSDQTFCAQTGSNKGDVVYIRSDLCSPEVNSPVDAAWLIIGEATHHLNSDRSNWEQAEENAFAAFQVIIARQNWNTAKIELPDARNCSDIARVSSALKHAIEKGDLKAVKYTIEKKKFDFLLGYVDASCNVTGFPVDDALAAGEWLEPDYWYRDNIKNHINVFNYLVTQGADIPTSLHKAIDRILNLDNLNNPLIEAEESNESYFASADAAFEILINSSERSHLTNLKIAAYVYGFSRAALYQRLEEMLPKLDLKEVALKIAEKVLFRNGKGNFNQLIDRGLVVDQELASKILLGSLKKAHRTNAVRTSSILEWLIPLGANTSGELSSQEILSEIQADTKTRILHEKDFLDGFSSLMENSGRIGLNWSAPLKIPDSDESYTLFDILFFYSKMHQNSYDVLTKFRLPLYSKPHLERLKLLSKTLEIMRNHGVSGSGKCYVFQVPGTNTPEKFYSIHETGPKIQSHVIIGRTVFHYPDVLKWNYYDTLLPVEKNDIPPVSVTVCSK